jgi:hypothetical protein
LIGFGAIERSLRRAHRRLDLADGNRVHFDRLDCLLSFGERWRAETTAGLQVLGLDPPAGDRPDSQP